MKRITLLKAKKEQVPLIVKISKDSFESDIEVGANEKGGPPDYDNVEWHEKMIEEGHLFAAIEKDKIIGGAILFQDSKNLEFMYVGRIFIDPKLFKKGYGIELMNCIEKMNPNVKTFALDTPIWNRRTNNFYQKIGYTETKRDDEFVYYQKIVNK